eukprot:c43876_g1_i1 orf=94-354(+)
MEFQLFADDSNAFCAAAEGEVDEVVELFNQHCLASGSRMNTQKTKAMWLGGDLLPTWCLKYGFQWIQRGQIMRHLGVLVGVGISML